VNVRHLWTPELARHYGVRPWEMHRVTPREVDAMRRHHEQMRREQEEN